jgi:hypothetical protein
MKTELYDHYIAGGLTPEEAALAVENADDPTEICEDVYYTLMGSFLFEDSPQGHKFWFDVAGRIDK